MQLRCCKCVGYFCICTPVRVLAAVELVRSVSWPDGIKCDPRLNEASVLLGLVLRVLTVFINSCLGFSVVAWL